MSTNSTRMTTRVIPTRALTTNNERRSHPVLTNAGGNLDVELIPGYLNNRTYQWQD
jgi:hypothetical protein